MRKTITLAALAAVAVALSGCGGLSAVGPQVLDNLQGCERNYNGAINAGIGGGFTGTLQIHCPAAPVKAEAEETTAD